MRNAEKFLRVGRLDAAIAEYARVVEDQPRDWTTANTLGDLYLRAGQSEKAVSLYQGIASHLLKEGFYPKAAALLKKILKITPNDEAALIHLGEISARQGLLAEARGYFNAVATRRRGRGDQAGADEMVVRLGALDVADLDARMSAARAMERRGDVSGAAAAFRELHDEFLARGREPEAQSALDQYFRCHPGPADAGFLLSLVGLDLRAGRIEQARARLRQLLADSPQHRPSIVAYAWTLGDAGPEAASACVDAAVEDAVAAGEYREAAGFLQELAAHSSQPIPALLRLVEVSVDGELDDTTFDAQARLADAYLAAGRAAEARVIAEDLVSRDVSDASHIARLRRALEMLGIDDAESVIAERLATAADRFEADPELPPAPEEAAVYEEPAVALAEEAVHAEPAPGGTEQAGQVADGEGGFAGGTTVAAAPPPGLSSGEIDLTAALGELHAAAPAATSEDLEVTFEAIRASADRDLDDEAGDYLDLARTCIEMDMQDEAMHALGTAVRSPRHRFRAAAALAQLHRDRGDLPAAIEWYERAAEAPAPDAEESRALLYDLGDLLETLGETSRALAIFMELQADSPVYRDVPRRVARLTDAEAGG